MLELAAVAGIVVFLSVIGLGAVVIIWLGLVVAYAVRRKRQA